MGVVVATGVGVGVGDGVGVGVGLGVGVAVDGWLTAVSATAVLFSALASGSNPDTLPVFVITPGKVGVASAVIVTVALPPLGIAPRTQVTTFRAIVQTPWLDIAEFTIAGPVTVEIRTTPVPRS